MFARLLPLIRKEFLSLIKDPKGRMVLIMPPILQLCIFAFSSTLEVKNNSITIYDEDCSPASVEISHRIAAASAFSTVNYVHDLSDLESDIEEGNSLLAVHFPSDFSKKLSYGGSPKIQVIVDGRRSNSGQIAYGYVSKIINQYRLELAQEKGVEIIMPTLVTRFWFNPNLIYLWYNIPGLLVLLTTVVTMIVTALSIARERELGTFDQLLVSPYTQWEILMGKSIPAFIVAMLEGLLIFSVGVGLYGVPFEGSMLTLLPCLSLYLISLVGVGLFISSLCRTQQQAILGAFCFMNPTILLSGFASPLENMPHWLQGLNQINPLMHFFAISKGIFLCDMSFPMAWPHVWPLIAISIFTIFSANWIFGHKVG